MIEQLAFLIRTSAGYSDMLVSLKTGSEGCSKMDKLQLHHELQRLHADLQQIESADNADREILSQLDEDIRRILEHRDPGAEHYQNLIDRLRDAIGKLEAAHPKTTMLMRQLLDQISYLGI